MGYYDAADVPVYDHLAEEFAVCDRWFSSVPGATLPNRLYALCGLAAGSRDDNDAVRREVPADRLLEWSPADGWEPICERLCLPAPDDPFPVTNTANETRAMFGFPPLDTAG
jgi:phospholipase C